jgi:hypothetical protein
VATVTVVMPVYNGADFIAAAIDSALAQTYRDLEIVVVDDGSTDDTPAVLARFGSRIRVIRQPNRGLAAARNAGLAAATGRYAALLDADDVWEAPFVERAVARLEAADESVVGVFSDWLLADRDGHALAGTRHMRRGVFGARDFLRSAPFPPSTLTLRRAPVLAIGGFDETLRAAEDWDLWLRMTAAGGAFLALEQCLCRYRVHEQNWSRDPDRMRIGALAALAKFFASPSLPAELEAERAAAFARVHARASSQLYAVRRAEEGAGALRDAVRAWPLILLEDETHWAIICAEQPAGYTGSPHHLDLARGERCILTALAACLDDGPDPQLRRRAYGRAYRALSQLAYGQRRMAAARRYVLRALRADRSLWSDWGTVGPWVKSFAGGAAIDTLRRWRRGADSNRTDGVS